VIVLGLGIAAGLVLLGARLAATPAPSPDISQPGSEAKPRDVNVIMRDYAFNPNPLYLVPGETVRFHLFNGGLIEHEFVLGDALAQQAWASADAAATPPAVFATPPPASVPIGIGGLRAVLASGGSAELTYQVPRDTSLELVCHLPGHVEQGMIGEVLLANR
jgi:uncharacterized cupredoxin-like copper-binding protein